MKWIKSLGLIMQEAADAMREIKRRIGHVGDEDVVRDLEREFWVHRQNLLEWIDKTATERASQIGFVVGLMLFAVLMYANFDLVERGIDLTWEMLAAMAGGTAAYFLVRPHLWRRLYRRFEKILAPI